MKVLCQKRLKFARRGVERGWLGKSHHLFIHSFVPCQFRCIMSRDRESFIKCVVFRGIAFTPLSGWRMLTRPFRKQFELSPLKRVTRCLSSAAPVRFLRRTRHVFIRQADKGRLIRTIPYPEIREKAQIHFFVFAPLTRIGKKKLFLIHSIRKSRMEMKSDEKRKEKITIKVKLIAFTQKNKGLVGGWLGCRRTSVWRPSGLVCEWIKGAHCPSGRLHSLKSFGRSLSRLIYNANKHYFISL